MKYTKVRIPTDLALALKYIAGKRNVERQALIQSLLAQVTLSIAPGFSTWEDVQACASIPLVPQLDVSERGGSPSISPPLTREEAEIFVESKPRPTKLPVAAYAWMAADGEEDYNTRFANLIRNHPEKSMDELRALAQGDEK